VCGNGWGRTTWSEATTCLTSLQHIRGRDQPLPLTTPDNSRAELVFHALVVAAAQIPAAAVEDVPGQVVAATP